MATIRKRDLPPDVAKRLGVKAPRRDTEHHEQRALIAWADDPVTRKVYPELRWLYAVPNGASASSPAAAARRKREGQRRGVPDLCLPVPRGRFHGLYVEMKAEKGRTSREQDEWLYALNEAGYYAAVAYGCEAARVAIIHYLDLR